MKISKLNFATALFLSLSMFLFSSCENDLLKPEGEIIADNYVLAEFNAIDISVPSNVKISKDANQAVTINSYQNYLDELDVRVEGKTLKISFDKNKTEIKEDVDIVLNLELLKSLDLSGAVDVSIGNFELLDHLDADLSGACNITFTEVGTSINTLNLEMSGAGSFEGFLATVNICNLDLSGACEVEINASEELNIDASGACTIRYKGEAELDADQSGTVTISNMN